jgi:hypothetical protein
MLAKIREYDIIEGYGGGWVCPPGPPGAFVISERKKSCAYPLASRLKNPKKLRISFTMDFFA